MRGPENQPLFCLCAEYLDPRFQAFELEAGQYVPAALGEGGAYQSRLPGVQLKPIGRMLRAIDPESGRPVPDLDEAMDEAEAEARRAEAAESELARLKARLAELEKGGQ